MARRTRSDVDAEDGTLVSSTRLLDDGSSSGSSNRGSVKIEEGMGYDGNSNRDDRFDSGDPDRKRRKIESKELEWNATSRVNVSSQGENSTVELASSTSMESSSTSVTRSEQVKKEESEDENCLISLSRDEIAKMAEDRGDIHFEEIRNDGSPRSMVLLTHLRNIISAGLPMMAKTYISRIVFDRKHACIIALQNDNVIGGVVYRPFLERLFVEIVFFVISKLVQVKGYGTRLMDHLKKTVQNMKIHHFLVYGDNTALNFFRKQGFVKVEHAHPRWKGFIKDYSASTLLECVIHPEFNYLDVPGIIKRQRAAICEKKEQMSNSGLIHPGIPLFKQGIMSIPIQSIPGVVESGWQPPEDSLSIEILHALCRGILDKLCENENAWPFLVPVELGVPGYYTTIKDPMDFSTVRKRLETGEIYRTKELFAAEILRIFSNCRIFNEKGSVYVQCADRLENAFSALYTSSFR